MLARAGRIAISAILTPLALAGAIWPAGTFWYHGVPTPGLAVLPAAACILLGFIAIWGIWRGRLVWLGILILLLAPFTGWWLSIAPRNDRVWQPEVAETVTYRRDGDIITVRNVRNFDWQSLSEAQERWETRSYDLATITGIDLSMLYFLGPMVAHTYIGFTFADGRVLSLSIEVRKEKDEPHSVIAGFFKIYELIILAGDERDFIGWRVGDTSQNVQLFRTNATPDEARGLLIGLLDRANGLAAAPEFYNTITDNCTTVVWDVTDDLGANLPLDWRILISGYLPDYFYALGRLDSSLPLEELRRRGEIMPKAAAALAAGLTGADFSAALRADIPSPQ